MLGVGGLLGRLEGRTLFLHAGYCYNCYRLGSKMPGILYPHWDRRAERLAEKRLVHRILAGTDVDLVNMALLAERKTGRIDPARLHRAFADPATRVNAMFCMPGPEFTADEMVLALAVEGRPAREAVIGKLRDCNHDDPRLLAEAILLAGREPELAAQALMAGIRHREKHAAPLIEQLLAIGRPQLRSIACRAVVDTLPREQAREILLKQKNDPDPKVRAQVEQLLGEASPTGQMQVGIAPPTAFDLRRAFDYRAWSYYELRYLPETVNPTGGLPEDPAALALAYWGYWRRPDPKRDAERCVPKEVAQKILPLLQGNDPGMSDAVAAVFLLGRNSEYARETVSYIAYHSPRNFPLMVAAWLGEAAAEPLAALAMHHPEQDLRTEALRALEGVIKVTHPDRQQPLPTLLQKSIIVLMLEGEYAPERIWALQQSQEFLPKEVHAAVCRKLLESKDEEFKDYVRRFVGDKRVPDVIRQGPQTGEVLAWASSTSSAQRQTAAFRASVLWDERLRDAMFVLLGDADSRVQRAAAAAIARRIGTDDRVPERLKQMLASEAPEDQLQALCAMAAEYCTGMPPSLALAVRARARSSRAEIRLGVAQALQPKFRSCPLV